MVSQEHFLGALLRPRSRILKAHIGSSITVTSSPPCIEPLKTKIGAVTYVHPPRFMLSRWSRYIPLCPLHYTHITNGRRNPTCIQKVRCARRHRFYLRFVECLRTSCRSRAHIQRTGICACSQLSGAVISERNTSRTSTGWRKWYMPLRL